MRKRKRKSRKAVLDLLSVCIGNVRVRPESPRLYLCQSYLGIREQHPRLSTPTLRILFDFDFNLYTRSTANHMRRLQQMSSPTASVKSWSTERLLFRLSLHRQPYAARLIIILAYARLLNLHIGRPLTVRRSESRWVNSQRCCHHLVYKASTITFILYHIRVGSSRTYSLLQSATMLSFFMVLHLLLPFFMAPVMGYHGIQ
jgi:hypothetical protein